MICLPVLSINEKILGSLCDFVVFTINRPFINGRVSGTCGGSGDTSLQNLPEYFKETIYSYYKEVQ